MRVGGRFWGSYTGWFGLPLRVGGAEDEGGDGWMMTVRDGERKDRRRKKWGVRGKLGTFKGGEEAFFFYLFLSLGLG